MTPDEIADAQRKLEILILKFEAGLGFDDRQTWHLMEKLLEHFEEIERENHHLHERLKAMEAHIAERFGAYEGPVLSS